VARPSTLDDARTVASVPAQSARAKAYVATPNCLWEAPQPTMPTVPPYYGSAQPGAGVRRAEC